MILGWMSTLAPKKRPFSVVDGLGDGFLHPGITWHTAAVLGGSCVRTISRQYDDRGLWCCVPLNVSPGCGSACHWTYLQLFRTLLSPLSLEILLKTRAWNLEHSSHQWAWKFCSKLEPVIQNIHLNNEPGKIKSWSLEHLKSWSLEHSSQQWAWKF